MESPACGGSPKQAVSLPPSITSAVWSVGGSPPGCSSTRSSVQGTMVRSRSVAKTTAGSVSVRSVATSVPVGSSSGCPCGADIQKVIAVCAGAGGNRVIPSRSRKAR